MFAYVGAFGAFILLYLVVPCGAQKPAAGVAHKGFDLAQLAPLHDSSGGTPAERIAKGIAFLQQELANPSPPRWGVGGGPIDSGYVLQAIIGSIAFPGAEDPAALRRYRDQAISVRIKRLLTISLAETGAQDTIPDLLRLVRSEPEGGVRYEAVLALSKFLRPPADTDVPKRLRPGEVWAPLNGRTVTAITDALIASLQDPFTRYRGPHDNAGTPYYPIMEQARVSIQRVGLVAEPVIQNDKLIGWNVFTAEGQLFRSVALKRPLAMPTGTGAR